jgi:hypothetical protein
MRMRKLMMALFIAALALPAPRNGRTGNWLNRDQVRLLLEKSDGESLRCTRDLTMISILLGQLTIKTLIQKGHFCPKRITSGRRVTNGHTISRISSPEPKRVSIVPTTLKPHAL